METFFFYPFKNRIKIVILCVVTSFCLCLLTACGKKTTFDDALEFSEDLAAVKINGVYGYVDSNLNVVIKPEYYQAKSFHKGVALVKKTRDWGAITKENEVVIPFKYKTLADFSKDLIVVNNYSKLGCINYKGDVVIDFKYDNIELYTYYKEINTFMPSQETFNLDCFYENYTPYNYALTYLGDKVGFIDLESFFTLEPKYTSIFISNTDNTILSLNSDIGSGTMYGFADLTAKTIVKPSFYTPLEFSEGLAAAQVPTASANDTLLYGYINKTGEFVIAPSYNFASKFSSGLAAVEDLKQRKYGYINKENEYIINPDFEKAYPFQNGSAIVKAHSKYTMINKTGEYLTDDYFLTIKFPNEATGVDSKLGFTLYKNDAGNYSTAAINNLGKTLFYTDYDYMSAFKNNTCIVGKSNKYGCINSRGIEIIPLIYDDIKYSAVENTFLVMSDKKYGIVSSENRKILSCDYDLIEAKTNNHFLLFKDDKYGFYDIKTKKLIEPIYDEIRFSSDTSITSIRKNKEWFFLDSDGNKLK